MSRTNTDLLKTALRALRATRTDSLVEPLTGGIGAIFMLHRVTPEPPKSFSPNRILQLTPDFLADVVDAVQEWGYDVISLDEVPGRIAAGEDAPPFACFTFDDGYRDNRDYAYPIFKKRDLPIAVYVPADFADGTGDLWWLVLEEAIRRSDVISCNIAGTAHRFNATTVAEKNLAFHKVYWAIRDIAEDDARAVVAGLAQQAGYDPKSLCRDLVMSWDELRAFATDPLITIGGHTVGHYALAKLPLERAHEEIAGSIARIELELKRPCRHFSYPYGSELAAGEREFELTRELGIKTAVTTRKGLIRTRHSDRLAGLPRVSLNGDYQELGLVRTLLSGLPFALFDACRQVSRLALRA